MPQEYSRKTARKRIKLPGGGTVDVPVITEISFIDAADRYQETQHTVDNTSTADRDVHVDTLGSNFNVERVNTWKIFDAPGRAQETQVTFDNYTGADSNPPHFSTHLQTHVVRYKNDPDDGNYIDSELIDSFAVIDPDDRYQETVYTLNNPQTDAEAQADPNDPDISDPSTNSIDPPWRTDPFQNLIGFSGDNPFIIFHIDFGFSQKVPFISYGTIESGCIDTVPPGGAVCNGGHMRTTSLKTKVQTLGSGWVLSGFPASGRTEPFTNSSGGDLLGPTSIDFVDYAQIDKDEGTAFAIPDLSTAEAALWADYGSNLQFGIRIWDFRLSDDTYSSCSNGAGLYCKTGLSPYEFSSLNFDLTGATLTDTNATEPIVYRAIGTQNSYVPGSDPLINRDFSPPYNMKITHQRPSSQSSNYLVYDMPFFGGAVEPMYSIPKPDTISYVNFDYINWGVSESNPAYIDFVDKYLPLRITVLFKRDGTTA